MNNDFSKCYSIISGADFCNYHICGPYDDEQCGKLSCPHCITKTEKLPLTNSYLKAKDAGEVE